MSPPTTTGSLWAGAIRSRWACGCTTTGLTRPKDSSTGYTRNWLKNLCWCRMCDPRYAQRCSTNCSTTTATSAVRHRTRSTKPKIPRKRQYHIPCTPDNPTPSKAWNCCPTHRTCTTLSTPSPARTATL